MYFGWIYDGILFFWTDIQGVFCYASIVDYRAVVAWSMRRLQTTFCSISFRALVSMLMMTLTFFMFFKVTRLEIGSWFYFCGGLSCKCFEQYYVCVGVDGTIGRCCERFWFWGLIVDILVGCWRRTVFGKTNDCVCRFDTLK